MTTSNSGFSPLAKACAGLLALAVAMGIGRFAFTPILPMMLQDAGLSISGGGLLASANYVGYLLGALSAMKLRPRPEVAIRLGLVAIAVTTLAMGMQVPFAAWLLLRLLAGAASAWVLISVSAWSVEVLASHGRPLLGSIVFAGVGTGIAAAGLICIALMVFAASSASAWTVLGAISALLTAGVWPLFRPTAPDAGRARQAASPYPWNADALRLVLCYGIFGFGYIIPATFLPVMAKQALQSSTLFAWSWPVFGAAAAISTLVAAPLVRLAGHRKVWMASHLVMATGVLLPVVSGHVLAVFAAALCVGGTFMVITLAGMQEAKRVAGPHAAVLIAAMTSAFAAGQIVGPLTITLGIGRDGGFSAALVLSAALLAASVFLLKEDAAHRIAPTR
jgi:MFS family permease